MRTEKEIYDLVLNFAFQDERIRIVTLEGSRTNVNIPKDNLQDYDITFFVIYSRRKRIFLYNVF